MFSIHPSYLECCEWVAEDTDAGPPVSYGFFDFPYTFHEKCIWSRTVGSSTSDKGLEWRGNVGFWMHTHTYTCFREIALRTPFVFFPYPFFCSVFIAVLVLCWIMPLSSRWVSLDPETSTNRYLLPDCTSAATSWLSRSKTLWGMYAAIEIKIRDPASPWGGHAARVEGWRVTGSISVTKLRQVHMCPKILSVIVTTSVFSTVGVLRQHSGREGHVLLTSLCVWKHFIMVCIWLDVVLGLVVYIDMFYAVLG